MKGRRLTIALLLAAATAGLGSAACGGQNSAGGPALSATPEQRPELSAESIRRDINGKWVRLKPADGKSEPRSWVFSPEEPKEIEVVEQKLGEDEASFLINMKTRTVPRARNPISIEGQLRLRYRLESGLVLRQWDIDEVENVSFVYTKLDPPPTPGDANANASNANAANANNANSNTSNAAAPPPLPPPPPSDR